MKSFFSFTAALALSVIAFVGCNKENIINGLDEPAVSGPKVCKMTFNGSVSGYDNSVLRGVDTKGSFAWNDGDKVYIMFYDGDKALPGEATYSSADGWSVYYEDDIPTGTGLRCDVRFFVDQEFANLSVIKCSPYTAIYESTDGTFDNNGNYLAVRANLAPKVGRIRFTGNPGDEIKVTGITTNVSFSFPNNAFTTSINLLQLTIDESGSTPYVYGSFSYSDRKISVIGNDYAYTRYCKDSVFRTGESGYMSTPTASSHLGWKNGLYVTMNDVEFRMMPVPGHEKGFFLIGETEVTTALYMAMNSSSSSDQTPIDYISYKDVNTSIKNLSIATGLQFSLPTNSQWQFAASGGLLSQGYTYSGSNNPDDVAWHSYNCSSKQVVKTKQPNELGIYDMSGNVSEYSSSTYTNYGTYPYVCGGNYKGAANNVTVSSISICSNRYDSGGKEYGEGFRLALNCY